jgi:hypothetical protein
MDSFRESWHEWQEDNLDEDQTRVVCLFCDESFDLAGPLISHIKVISSLPFFGSIAV